MPQLELKLTLKIDIPDAAAASYYIDATTGEATADVIADIFDTLGDWCSDPVVSINDKTHEQISTELRTRLP
jgi:hypothetical protein